VLACRPHQTFHKAGHMEQAANALNTDHEPINDKMVDPTRTLLQRSTGA